MGLHPDSDDPVTNLAAIAREYTAPDSPRILVLGCAHSSALEWLLWDGMDAYGIDSDRWGLDLLDVDEDRLRRDDVRRPHLLDRAREDFGVERFDVVYTERLLSPLGREDAVGLCRRLRECGGVGQLVHLCWPIGAANPGEELEEWMEACDPGGEDVWVTPTHRG